jgi:hypothetical protein
MTEGATATFTPGERITHGELGQGVVLDAIQERCLRAFFAVGERRVPVGTIQRELSRTERILRAVEGDADRAHKAWLSYEARALPVGERLRYPNGDMTESCSGIRNCLLLASLWKSRCLNTKSAIMKI